MPTKHRPAEHDSARPNRRHKRPRKDYLWVIGIAAAGVTLAFFTRSWRGHAALIFGCLSVLAAHVYWHRRNPAAVRLLVGVLPAAIILGMALALTQATKPTAVDVTAGASSSTEMVSAGMVDGGRDVLGKFLALFIGS